jgi:hypothetical protein
LQNNVAKRTIIEDVMSLKSYVHQERDVKTSICRRQNSQVTGTEEGMLMSTAEKSGNHETACIPGRYTKNEFHSVVSCNCEG